MTTLTLKASDGHQFGAYEAKPSGETRGGLVVMQEIFGVTAHIRRVADGYAADGYHVIAPAIFDRAEREVELDYDKSGIERGRKLREKISIEQMLHDIAACRDVLMPSGKVAVVGYCLGGSLAWLSATRVSGFAAAIGYYGGMIARHLDEKPKCPVLLHFGEEDPSIPMSDVAAIKAAVDPKLVQAFSYAGAGHAFNRDGSHAFHEPSARLARERTLAFLRDHVG